MKKKKTTQDLQDSGWPWSLTFMEEGATCHFHESCAYVLSCLSRVRLFATLWTVAHQAPLSMGSAGKSTGVGCLSLLQGTFLTQGSNSPSPALTGGFFTTSSTWEALYESYLVSSNRTN